MHRWWWWNEMRVRKSKFEYRFTRIEQGKVHSRMALGSRSRHGPEIFVPHFFAAQRNVPREEKIYSAAYRRYAHEASSGSGDMAVLWTGVVYIGGRQGMIRRRVNLQVGRRQRKNRLMTPSLVIWDGRCRPTHYLQ